MYLRVHSQVRWGRLEDSYLFYWGEDVLISFGQVFFIRLTHDRRLWFRVAVTALEQQRWGVSVLAA